ncbi:MAG: hypothetical protein LH609_08900 [Rudanella sp.]|nr:hypothetical protein [Rudanella sp.]
MLSQKKSCLTTQPGSPERTKSDMKKITILCMLAFASGLTARATTIERIQFGVFGQVMIYRPVPVQSAILFVLGGGGRTSGVVDGVVAGPPRPSAATASVPAPLSKLPLIITPATEKSGEPMAVILSGDGGWTSFDETLAKTLAGRGIPSVGFDAQKYFWSRKTPETTTADISKVMDQYGTVWGKSTFVLMGYSFGANIVPFVANRLPPVLAKKLQSVVMLSPDKTTDFEIHVLDMLNLGRDEPYDVAGEVEKRRGARTLCLFGSEETQADAVRFRSVGASIAVLPGGHHYANDFRLLAETISQYLRL